MGSDDARRARNEDLLRKRLQVELEAGRAFVEDRIGHLFPGFFGRVLNPLAKSLYHHIGEEEVRKRAAAQLELILSASRDVESRGIEAAFAEWGPRALDVEELVHRANRSHPKFPELSAVLAEGFRERLATVTRFAREAEGSDFDAAARSAFPEPAVLVEVFVHQFGVARRSIAIVEADPAILRFPKPLLPPLFRLVRDTLAWYEAHTWRELSRVYGRPVGPA